MPMSEQNFPDFPVSSRRFLWLATWFEGSLIAVAYGIGWLVSLDPLQHLHLGLSAWLYGLMGTLPLALLFAWSYGFPHAGMREIRRFLVERLGPLLAACRWHELFYLASLAGVCEEILFRGALQPWLERDWGWLGGLVFSNLMFALAHWITPLYGFLAGLTGLYLGLALDVAGERNLLIPILIHAVYDFLAFLVVARTFRRESAV